MLAGLILAFALADDSPKPGAKGDAAAKTPANAEPKAEAPPWANLPPEKRAMAEEAHRLDREMERLYKAGKSREALPLAERSLKLNEAAYGPDKTETAASVNNLAAMLYACGELADAERLFRRALAIDEKLFGPDHPDTATSIDNLASLLKSRGDLAAAEPLCRRALAIREKALGSDHPDTTLSLNNLALLLTARGDLAAAEPLVRRALAIREKARGPNHPDTAKSLHNLAILLESRGDLAAAESLVSRVLSIREKTLGPDHPDTAASISNLASLLRERGDLAAAEPHYRRALAIWEKAVGRDHPDTASLISNLASVLAVRGDLAAAELHYRRALAIWEKALGYDHPNIATVVNNLACLLLTRGDLATAEPLYRRALAIREKALGRDHPSTATVLNNLAALLQIRGDLATAEPLLRQAMVSSGRHVVAALPGLPEAAALALAASDGAPKPGSLLTVARRLGRKGTDVYGDVWPARALVTRAIAEHKLAVGASSATRAAADRLTDVRRRLARVTLTSPMESAAKERRQATLAKLADEKEEAERALAALSASFGRRSAAERSTPTDLVARLPKGVAVVDLLASSDMQPTGRGTLQGLPVYEAFVVTGVRDQASGVTEKKDAISWVHLGDSAPISAAVVAWRRQLVRSAGRGLVATVESSKTAAVLAERPEQTLRRLVWEPLAPQLVGCHTVVIVADGALTGLPWAALPGKRFGSCLVDELAIATASWPQAVLEMLLPDTAKVGGLLALGGVRYDDARIGPATGWASRGVSDVIAGRPKWDYLVATAAELTAITALWPHKGEVVHLDGAKASEAALLTELPKARYAHLATHGFFADKQFRSAFQHDEKGERLFGSLGGDRRATVTGRNPLILSGIVLAGANLPAKTDELGLPTSDDGILTAEELVGLDLSNLELAVLSACETGLGEVAGGEGVFGLQRAFALAGCRTSIASLWKVDDDATRFLMEEFYRNLWHKKLSKLEALRQAQLAVRRKPGWEHPYYWAAWTLQGDWR